MVLSFPASNSKFHAAAVRKRSGQAGRHETLSHQARGRPRFAHKGRKGCDEFSQRELCTALLQGGSGGVEGKSVHGSKPETGRHRHRGL